MKLRILDHKKKEINNTVGITKYTLNNNIVMLKQRVKKQRVQIWTERGKVEKAIFGERIEVER